MLSNGSVTLRKLRLITFDVTGTLLRFRKPPVLQYVETGTKYGVHADVERMQEAFKQQWQRLNKSQPNYGLCWRSWWTELVIKTFQNSDASGNLSVENLNTIASDLIEYFTRSGWEAKPGATELLLAIKSLPPHSGASIEDERKLKENPVPFSIDDRLGNKQLGSASASIQIGVVSNFDPRLESILHATQLHSFFDFFLTSHECQVSKPHQGIFDMALLTATKNPSGDFVVPIQPSQALHIGDSYDLDFLGAINAGWNAMLVMSSKDQHNLPSHILNSSLVFNDLIQLKSYLQSTNYPNCGKS